MKRLVTLLFSLFLAVVTFGQNVYENHVIVALDARSDLKINQSVWNSNEQIIRNQINAILKKNKLEKGIVSTLTYSIESSDNDLSHYTHNVETAVEFNNNNLTANWTKLAQTIDNGSRFSLLSIAKPYCLKSVACSTDENSKLTNKTYLILITDLKYNGNDDFHDELRHKPGMSQTLLNSILGEVKTVQQNYFYDFMCQVPLTRGYMMMFYCVPQQKYFALESVVEYPHNIIANRTKDGYKISLSMNSYDNPNYQLINSVLSVGHHEKTLSGFGTVDFNISSDTWQANDTIHLKIKSWVRLLDGIYNRTVLSPDGNELQGKNGLNRTVVIEKEADAKILWLIPLPDFLYKISFWTADQYIAAGVWSVIFILIIFLIILYFIGKTMKYKPGNYNA